MRFGIGPIVEKKAEAAAMVVSYWPELFFVPNSLSTSYALTLLIKVFCGSAVSTNLLENRVCVESKFATKKKKFYSYIWNVPMKFKIAKLELKTWKKARTQIHSINIIYKNYIRLVIFCCYLLFWMIGETRWGWRSIWRGCNKRCNSGWGKGKFDEKCFLANGQWQKDWGIKATSRSHLARSLQNWSCEGTVSNFTHKIIIHFLIDLRLCSWVNNCFLIWLLQHLWWR